jgi:hypothetical protein
MKLAPDGSFIFSGGNMTTTAFLASKITPAGNLDNAFGINGTASFSVSTGSEDVPLGLDVQSDGKILLSGKSLAQGDNAYNAVLARLNVAAAVQSSYTFTGNGNWNDPGNWAGGVVPPNPIPFGIEVFINHSNGGQCVLNVPVTVSTGGKITVNAGKTFRAAANITLPAITTQ